MSDTILLNIGFSVPMILSGVFYLKRKRYERMFEKIVCIYFFIILTTFSDSSGEGFFHAPLIIAILFGISAGGFSHLLFGAEKTENKKM